MDLQAGRLRGLAPRGKSGHHRAGCWVTPRRGNPTEERNREKTADAATRPQVRVKRCGKSAPAVPVTVPARQAPPGATPDRDDDAARRVPGRRQRAGRQRLAQMDGRPRQNPAYRPATKTPAPAGVFYSAEGQFRTPSSCSDQRLPSGSSKNTNLPQAKSWTSLASIPRSQEFVARGRDVGDDDLRARRAERCVGEARAERDRAGRARRRQLHEPQLRRSRRGRGRR